MKNKKLFDETIAILVKAYHEDTLAHSNCAGCAVGNIIAARNNIIIKKLVSSEVPSDVPGYVSTSWFDNHGRRLGTNSNIKPSDWYRHIMKGIRTEVSEKLIESTGYTVLEIVSIERAFESAKTCDDIDKSGYKGLMAVVDILMEIHECDDKVLLEETKALF